MTRPPEEPKTNVTFAPYVTDYAYLRAKHPNGGHLVFLRDLLRSWVRAMKEEPDSQEPTDDSE